MNKHDYINVISRTLSGRVRPDVQKETVEYYKEYIDSQIIKGTKEEMVLAALGDPALLAKTVIASQPEPYGDEAVRSAIPESEKKRTDRKLTIMLIVIIVVLLFALGLVFKIVWKLMPVLLPVAVILFAVKKLREK